MRFYEEPDLFSSAEVALHVMVRQQKPVPGLEQFTWLRPVHLWVCTYCGYICTDGERALLHEVAGVAAENL